ncbi:hypothetical protein VPH35_089654 [Triticum aestivum]
MDRSRASSSEAIFGQKRRRNGSNEAAADLEYEAALRAKLQASLAPEAGSAAAAGWRVSPRLWIGPVGASPPRCSVLLRLWPTPGSWRRRPVGRARQGHPRRLLRWVLLPGAALHCGLRWWLGVGRPASFPVARRGPQFAVLSVPLLGGAPDLGLLRLGTVSFLLLLAVLVASLPNPKEDSHLMVDYHNRVKPPAFVHYGTGLPGCSFFALDRGIPEAAPIPSLSNVGIIFVQAKRISSQTLLDELKLWDEGGWDWQIRQLSEFDFAATFPSKESLRMISSCTSFTLPLNQLVVSVKAASNGSKAISSLSDVWVLVEDVPPNMRTTAFLMAFGVLIGKPIEVDQDSLAILGPARLRVWCVDPLCIHGAIDVFPAAGGFRL